MRRSPRSSICSGGPVLAELPRISRAVAAARVTATYGRAPCLMCAVLSDPRLAEQRVAETPACVTIASRYPVTRGHLLVVARAHVESVVDAPPDLWAALCAEAQRAARRVEAVVRPARTWIASLGATAPDAPMTCAHLHLHVIPVPDAALRPAEVFTWARGVLDTDADWWRADMHRLRRSG